MEPEARARIAMSDKRNKGQEADADLPSPRSAKKRKLSNHPSNPMSSLLKVVEQGGGKEASAVDSEVGVVFTRSGPLRHLDSQYEDSDSDSDSQDSDSDEIEESERNAHEKVKNKTK